MELRRIVIVDDHPLLAIGLRAELERAGAEVELPDPTVGPDQLVDSISSRRPDCAVIDLGLPFDGGGSALIGPLVAEAIRVVILTGETERQALAHSSGEGAEVVLSKSEPLVDIVETILGVAGGQTVRPRQREELSVELHRLEAEQNRRHAPFSDLSPREQQVLAGLMSGHGPAALAERHYVSVATIRAQVRSVLRKLGVSSQLEAVVLAHRNQWSLEADQT
ncbi:MAG: response regulator transcription factor [Acidimicrobiia bacterium]|nr:response regulator transcription factor [Acidimicrobiia bacterium]